MIILAYIVSVNFVAGLCLGSAAVVGTSPLGDAPNRFVGIWYNNIPGSTIVWVLKIASDRNLVVLDGQGKLCWTTNVTNIVSDHHSVAELLDTGNLVLRESSPNYNYNQGRYFWQSFDHPANTLLPKMQFGVNLRTGEKQTITSWKNDSDPSTGDFTLELDPKWRSGPWVENLAQARVEEFMSMDHPGSDFKLERDYSKGTVFLSLSYDKKSALSRIVLDSGGKLVGKQWHEEKKECEISWSSDSYDKCGPFGIYNQYSSQTCSCIIGFEPKFISKWKDGNWSGGCARRKVLQCEISSNITANQNSESVLVREADGFLAVDIDAQCHDKCLHNCSCIAYSYSHYDPSFGCMWWTGDLIDTHETSKQLGFNLHIRVANSELEEFAVYRPTMATTLSMLTSEIATLPAPKNPAFTERRVSSDSTSSRKISDNNVSITILGGR
ncbi:hypothetical protein MKW98_021733 [Papaver atlanticum]|uniref:Uncharacterized protein n=1 Tax=Papaver atlanticum TaxID=357466 RepID=A0AAD4SG93_9MAGN|nr:hypothetical protein MKW98_021733 [Papaver atlanticum]